MRKNGFTRQTASARMGDIGAAVGPEPYKVRSGVTVRPLDRDPSDRTIRGKSMGTRDARVDAYVAKSAEFARPILEHLREAVHAACPDVEETMKWSFPHFMYKGMLCSMASFKGHCAFGFWKGSLVVEKAGGEAEKAMGQFGRIVRCITV
jgi:hypothetical protein